MSRFDKGDHVVCPSGETGRVIGITLEGIVVKYDGALIPEHGLVTLPEKLLVKFVPGLNMPKPKRVTA